MPASKPCLSDRSDWSTRLLDRYNRPPDRGPPGKRIERLPRRNQTPWQAPLQRLADSDFSSLTSGRKYACDDGQPATVSRSSPSTSPMATGFWLNATACLQIRAERRTLRHYSNSSAATQ